MTPVLSVSRKSVAEARHSSRFSATQGTSTSRRFITANGSLQSTSILAFRWNPSSAKTGKISATIDVLFPTKSSRETVVWFFVEKEIKTERIHIKLLIYMQSAFGGVALNNCQRPKFLPKHFLTRRFQPLIQHGSVNAAKICVEFQVAVVKIDKTRILAK